MEPVSRETTITSTHAATVPVPRVHSIAVRYLSALGMVAVSTLLTMAIESNLQRTIFLLFWPAVIFAAWFGGTGPAIFTSVLSVVVVDYLFVAPRGFISIDDPLDLFTFALFLFTSFVVSTLTGRLRDERMRAALAAANNASLATELEMQSEILSQQAAELEQQLEESQVMSEELEQSSAELAARTAESENAEHFTRGILESIADPFVVQDAEWRFRFINERARDIFRQTVGDGQGDIIGRVVWDVYPQLIGSNIEQEMRRAATQRRPVSFEAYYPATGSWSLLYCYPLPDGGLATQWKDITARKRAEESAEFLSKASIVLAESLDYETTLTKLAHIIVPRLADWCAVEILYEDGKSRQLAVAHVDPAKVQWAHELNRRYPPDPNSTTGVPNVLRTGKPELYPDIPDELLVAGAKDAEHLRISRELGLKSAMVVPLIAHERTVGALTFVSAESGRRYTNDDLQLALELARRAALAVDNARHHRAALDARSLAEHSARAAEDANKAKTQFLATMSHELRTPLNAIAGYAELLRMGLRGPTTPEQDVDLARISRSQQHLLSLINDILNFARLEAGRVEYDSIRITVSDLLSGLESMVGPQLAAQELEFTCDPVDENLAVRADAEKVHQVLLNLLANAVKFTDKGGKVAIGCDADDEKVHIRVHDTGIGIPTERLDSIFEPFVQVNRSLTSTSGGTGLGLAISRDLARGMNGELSVSSEIGQGSTFTLSLPRA
jgi:signal transduction histidine kinase/PAS domain-containing protein